MTLSILPISIPGLVILPTVEFAARPKPVETHLQTLSLTTASVRAEGKAVPPLSETGPDGHRGAGQSHQPVVSTDEIETEPFRLVATTWISAEADVVTWVRSRAAGKWSRWHELPQGDTHAPDPGSAEAEQARAGTDPLVVPESDAVQVRVDTADGSIPSDMRLDLIDPGTSPIDATVGTSSGSVAAAAPGRPVVLTRAQWGADETLRESGPPDYGAVHGAFVHHTVNANDYAPADVPAIIRAIYAYHVSSRGWRDIGYNFLVDRFGRIWEGRYGGVELPVVGAHTAGYNDDAFAMSAIGTYTTKDPELALIRAYQRLFAWKFAIHGVDPREPVNYDGEIWPAIAGHRDAKATECPGEELYRRLPSIRVGVIAILGAVPTTLGRDVSHDGYPDVLARRPDGSLWLRPGKATGGFGPLTVFGSGWQIMNSIVMPGDWNDDGADDVMARRASTGSLWLYAGDGQGRLRRPIQIGTGWKIMNMIIAPGDFDSDGLVDVIARRIGGSLWLYPGNGQGGFRTPKPIGTGWHVMNELIVPGDFEGDGHNDLLARRASDGTLWLYRGSGKGLFERPVRAGHGWNQFDRILGAGDVDRDDRMDLLARRPDGSMLLYPGNGFGGFRAPIPIGAGWDSFDLVV